MDGKSLEELYHIYKSRKRRDWVNYLFRIICQNQQEFVILSVIFLKHFEYGNSIFYSNIDDEDYTLVIKSFIFFPLFFPSHQRWYTFFSSRICVIPMKQFQCKEKNKMMRGISICAYGSDTEESIV